MNRDKAIEIAAKSYPQTDTVPFEYWASVIVARADALLVAMGEDHPSGPSIDRKLKEYARGMADAKQSECCAAQARITEAATEARVVAEIADYLDNGGYSGAGAMVRCGDWRTKVER